MAKFLGERAFGSGTVPEIPLEDPPLVLVVAQVRFSQITSIARHEFIGPFQERIRSSYPLLHAEHGFALALGAPGASVAPADPVWRFAAADESWVISLAPDFVSLTTHAYVSRTDFLARLLNVLRALEETISPAISDRLGVRFINRLQEADELARADGFIRPEMLGITALDHAPAVLQDHLSLARFAVEDGGSLQVKWGLLPADRTIDPMVPECPQPSWVLDIDRFSASTVEFNAEGLVETTGAYMEAVYRFFRWVMSEEFLSHRGAKL